MSIVVSNKQRIRFEMEGERGAFLILHHGLFGSHRDWVRAGYVQSLAGEFRLILPDARGHGRSDRPIDPAAYAPEQFSADLIAVMNELDIRNAHFVGYSLGALVGLDLVLRHPERVRLIMLGGESPAMMVEAQTRFREWAARIRAEGFAAWLADQRRAGHLAGEDAPLAGEDESALALLEGLAAWPIPFGEPFQVGSPITIFSATEDAAFERTQRISRKFQRARFVPVSAHTHRSLFEQKDAFLEAMLRFIKISRKPEGGPIQDRRDAAPGEQQGEGRSASGGERQGAPSHDPAAGNPAGIEGGTASPEQRGTDESVESGAGQRDAHRQGSGGPHGSRSWRDRRGLGRRDRPWQSEQRERERRLGEPTASAGETPARAEPADSPEEPRDGMKRPVPPDDRSRQVESLETIESPEPKAGAEPLRDSGAEPENSGQQNRSDSRERGETGEEDKLGEVPLREGDRPRED